MLLEDHPELGPLYRKHLADPYPLDLRPELAAAKALLEHYLRRANLDERVGPNGTEAATLRALTGLERVGRIASALVKIESEFGVITHADMGRAMSAVALTFGRYVPRERVDEAREFLQEQLAVIVLGRTGREI
jgi:hypothetical protein